MFALLILIVCHFSLEKMAPINSKQISDLIVQFILTLMFSINNLTLTVTSTDSTWALNNSLSCWTIHDMDEFVFGGKWDFFKIKAFYLTASCAGGIEPKLNQ